MPRLHLPQQGAVQRRGLRSRLRRGDDLPAALVRPRDEAGLHLFTKYTEGRELYWETSPDGVTWGDDRMLAGLGGHYQVSGAATTRSRPSSTTIPAATWIGARTSTTSRRRTSGRPGPRWTAAAHRPAPRREQPRSGHRLRRAGQTDVRVRPQFRPRRAGRSCFTSPAGAPHPGRRMTARVPPHAWDGHAWQTATIAEDRPQLRHGEPLGVRRRRGPSSRRRRPARGPTAAAARCASGRAPTRARPGRSRRKSRRQSAQPQLRPTPGERHDPFFAFWADGDPAQFSESRLYFCDSSGEHVRQLPYDMDGEFAEPVEIRGECQPLSPPAARHVGPLIPLAPRSGPRPSRRRRPRGGLWGPRCSRRRRDGRGRHRRPRLKTNWRSSGTSGSSSFRGTGMQGSHSRIEHGKTWYASPPARRQARLTRTR